MLFTLCCSLFSIVFNEASTSYDLFSSVFVHLHLQFPIWVKSMFYILYSPIIILYTATLLAALKRNLYYNNNNNNKYLILNTEIYLLLRVNKVAKLIKRLLTSSTFYKYHSNLHPNSNYFQNHLRTLITPNIYNLLGIKRGANREDTAQTAKDADKFSFRIWVHGRRSGSWGYDAFSLLPAHDLLANYVATRVQYSWTWIPHAWGFYYAPNTLPAGLGTSELSWDYVPADTRGTYIFGRNY